MAVMPVLLLCDALIVQNILECGSKKSSAKQTVSLFLSEKLRRHRHGFEYGALEVKNHLEGLAFSDIVSTVMIMLVYFFSLSLSLHVPFFFNSFLLLW